MWARVWAYLIVNVVEGTLRLHGLAAKMDLRPPDLWLKWIAATTYLRPPDLRPLDLWPPPDLWPFDSQPPEST